MPSIESSLEMAGGAGSLVGMESARLQFLLETSQLLTSLIDDEGTLDALAGAAVPALADLCMIDLLQPDGGIRRAAVAHADPAIQADAAPLLRQWPPDPAGEHPVARAIRSSEPQLGSHMPPGLLEATTAGPEHLALVRRLDFQSYLAVPLHGRDSVLGAVLLISTTPDHHYSARDVDLAEVLARSAALSLDTARLVDDKDASLALLESVLDAAPMGLAFFDPDLRFVRVNRALAEMNGRSAEDRMGRRVDEVLGDIGRELASHLRSVFATGESVSQLGISGEHPFQPSRGVRHYTVNCFPVRSREGAVTFAGVTVVDQTDSHRAEDERSALLEREMQARSEAEQAMRRVALLAAATAILAESLDTTVSLSRLAQVVVPGVADWCAIHLRDADAVVQVAVAHADRERAALLSEVEAEEPMTLDSGGPIAFVLRTGEPLLIHYMSEAEARATARSARQLEVYHQLGLKSGVIVPMLGRSRDVLGTISLGTADSGRMLSDTDLSLAKELAHRAGLSVDNARLREREHERAVLFQNALLPGRLPTIDKVVTAARYIPATEETRVGGDWFDVLPLDDGRIRLAIGDVVGHDVRAAVSMGTVRHALRAYSWTFPEPRAVLTRLNSLVEGTEPGLLASVLYAVFDPSDSSLRWASAGHPPALLVEPGTGASFLERPASLMIGSGLGGAFPAFSTSLGSGATVVLYTDGLVEKRGSSVEDGLARLSEVAAAHSRADPDDLLEALVSELLDPEERHDDVAVLAMKAL